MDQRVEITQEAAEAPTASDKDFTAENEEVAGYAPEAASVAEEKAKADETARLAAETTPSQEELAEMTVEKLLGDETKFVAAPPSLGGPAPTAVVVPVVEAVPAAPVVAPLVPDTMSTEVSRNVFMTAINATAAQWDTLGTAEARGLAFGAAGAQALEAVGVKKPDVIVVNMSNEGELRFWNWELALNKRLFDKATAPSVDELAAIAEVVYHEARHGEQWFRVCQTYAGRDALSDVDIANTTGVPLDVAKAAHDEPIGKDGAAIDPDFIAWLDSIYGANAAHRNTTLTDLAREGATLTTLLEATNDRGKEYEVLTDALKVKQTAFETAVDNFNAKQIELENRATAWRQKDAERKAFEPTYIDVVRKAADAAVVRDAAAATWWEKDALRKTATTEREAAKAAQDTSAEKYRSKSSNRSLTARNWHTKKSQQAAAESRYRSAVDAYQALKTGSGTEEQKDAARETACTAWNQLVDAQNAFAMANTFWQNADAEFKAAEEAFKRDDAAFKAADTKWNEANTAFQEADAAWKAADADHTAKKAAYTEADRQYEALNSEAQTILDGWRACKVETEALEATKNTAHTEYSAKHAEQAAKLVEHQAAFAAWQAQKVIFDPIDAAYHALPEEVDAWREGTLISTEYKRLYGGGGGGG